MFFWVAKYVMWVVMHLMFRIKVTGKENIPAKGGFILCSNHIHAFDPIAHTICIKRQLGFMAKKELFDKKCNNKLMRALGAFPVNRETTDVQSYKTALDLLKRGKGLLIFSQGTRMKAFDSKAAKGGVAVFGLKSEQPIIPASITATYKLFSTIHIRYGTPITLEAYQGQRIKSDLIDKVTAQIMSEVQRLTE